jgi:hypothetical protein
MHCPSRLPIARSCATWLALAPRFAHGASGRHIHVMPRSYESLRAELDDIVERYRAHSARDGDKGGLTREEAVKRIRQLDFTESDAERWLGSKPRSKSFRLTSR